MWLRYWRRERIAKALFPNEWECTAARLEYWHKVTEQEREELRTHTKVLLAEKNWEGCGGLVLDDRIKVAIAAQASLLLLHRPATYFPVIESILVYPTVYLAKDSRPLAPGVYTEWLSLRAGEAWREGMVVLSWEDVEEGLAHPGEGHNVVIHEFAHALDYEDGVANGVPPLESAAERETWRTTLSGAFEELRRTEPNKKSFLDSYGAANPAEFFAVITETFFCRPKELAQRHPALYEVLRSFYHQNPANR